MVETGSRERRHLVAVLLVATALRILDLGAESLWTDELLTLLFVERWSGLELAVQLPQAQPHLPVYYLLLDAWVSLAGTSEFALRLPSAVFGIAAVGVTYLVGRQVATHGVGLLAATMLAVSKFHIRYSQEVRMYALLTLLVLCSVYLLLRLRCSPTRRTAIAYGAVTVLLLYTHVFAVFVVAAEGIWAALVLFRDRPDRRFWVAAFAPVGVALVPMAVAVALRVDGGVSYSFIPRPGLSDLGTALAAYLGYSDGPHLPLYLLALAVACGLAAVGTLGAGRLRPTREPRLRGLDLPAPSDDRTLFGLVFLAALGLPFVVSYLVTPVFWLRYTIAAMLPFFLLVALGTTRVDPPPLRYALVGLVVLTMLPQLGVYYTETQKQEWDEVGGYIERNAADGDLVVVADQISVYGAEHYVERDDVRVQGLVTAASGTGYTAASNATVREMFAGEDRIWLVFTHVSEREEARVRALADERHAVALDREYVGLELALYERAEREGHS